MSKMFGCSQKANEFHEIRAEKDKTWEKKQKDLEKDEPEVLEQDIAGPYIKRSFQRQKIWDPFFQKPINME